ncbi:glycosyltransferase [Agromyces sp. MMS17-SY077]|uniref:Glycosyltransferase n=2 Tax=Agromyces seonyuensis TaxID=2662446 RepID=A0A6I4P142_9MICO|nr:glycosyltransferase [Agromyces seonyuensis]
MTLMVRDEADIIEAMLEHHLEQGVDHFIVTDNGSLDGTREILERYAASGRIDLRHDPEHRKQQHAVVTGMSRDAARAGADWVLNADADEFWVAVDPDLTLHEAFERIDPALGAFPVPVTDMIGAPARRGTGLGRLVYRDLRPIERMHELGLHSHSTDDVAFVPNPEVTVAQGNHFADVESHGLPPEALRIEVLHFPWRSWTQFERKVVAAGQGYERSPHLKPSANHHGMRDYRRQQDGTLLAAYIRRHPDDAELTAGLASGAFVAEDRIASRPSIVDDELFDDAELAEQRNLAELVAPVEQHLQREISRTRLIEDELARVNEGNRILQEEQAQLEVRLVEHNQALAARTAEVDGLRAELDRQRSRRVVRAVDRAADGLNALRGRPRAGG